MTCRKAMLQCLYQQPRIGAIMVTFDEVNSVVTKTPWNRAGSGCTMAYLQVNDNVGIKMFHMQGDDPSTIRRVKDRYATEKLGDCLGIGPKVGPLFTFKLMDETIRHGFAVETVNSIGTVSKSALKDMLKDKGMEHWIPNLEYMDLLHRPNTGRLANDQPVIIDFGGFDLRAYLLD